MLGFEPGTILILAVGILGLACVVRRKLKSDFPGLKPDQEFTVLRIFDR